MKKWIKRLVLLLVLLLMVVLAWYFISRIQSTGENLKRYDVSLDDTVSAGSSVRSGNSLRVAAFNMAHGRGPGVDKSNWDGGDEKERKERLRSIAEQIKSKDLDILVLNEVDFDCAWSGHINQAEFIAKEAGFPHVIEQRNIDASFPFLRFRFGNAILSKLPVSGEKRLDFPALSRAEVVFAGSKDGLICELELPWTERSGGKKARMRVVAVHLEHRAERIRVECAQMFLNLLERERTPLLLLGDFNSTPTGYHGSEKSEAGENAIDLILSRRTFVTSVSGAESAADHTFPIPSPDRVLDWIFVSDHWTFKSKEVLATELSDHAMVVGEIVAP